MLYVLHTCVSIGFCSFLCSCVTLCILVCVMWGDMCTGSCGCRWCRPRGKTVVLKCPVMLLPLADGEPLIFMLWFLVELQLVI